MNEAFRRINAAIEKRRLEILEEVKTSIATKITQLEIQKEGLEKTTADLQLALDSGRVACTEYSTIETLAIKAFIHQLRLQMVFLKSHIQQAFILLITVA